MKHSSYTTNLTCGNKNGKIIKCNVENYYTVQRTFLNIKINTFCNDSVISDFIIRYLLNTVKNQFTDKLSTGIEDKTEKY